MKMFNVRAVSLDHYLSRPIDELYDKENRDLVKEWQEPVIRIFGSTTEGLKSCVHVHGVYPYIYVPYKGGENPERDALLLGAALNEALKTSLNTKIVRFVHKVTPISGIPLYGYHSKHRQFFKIYFYNPYHIKKSSELLLSGAILGQKFQPHEAHIPYILQFMMDYNIYGMSFVTFSKVRYRRNPENPDSLTGVKEEDILSEKVKRMTWSYLEVDAWACDILNRSGQKAGVNPGLQAIWEDEKDRRRAQDRCSQITIQQSQSRPEVKLLPTEMMYKARLAQKLAEMTPEDLDMAIIPEEPTHSYPAEVPAEGDLLEASAIDEGVEHPPPREDIGDVTGLIDEKILTQISGNAEEKAGSESEDEMEFGSVLGRNQKSEEEAEPEDEEGVDMTQPLDDPEEVICGAEGNRRDTGSSSGDGEDTFWKNMADKIFQLDGAQESSSESEVDTTPSEFAPVQDVSDGSPELSSAWSTNIMSILSEGSDCPTPAATCPTPRTFWFDYSADYLTQNQDAWNKNFADLPGKTCLDNTHFPGGSKEMTPSEPYTDIFASNGEYFPSGTLCGTESNVSGVVPPDVDINLDSILGSLHPSPKEKRKVPPAEETNGNDEQKVLQVLNSFAGRKVPLEENSGHLTLKQYIKDCKEIVSVDFKNLCNREMIIIEYKSQNKRSLRNKYLIKPLDKFLESWNTAERKATDRRDGGEVKLDTEKNVRSNYVINVLEKRFSDSSTVQSLSNKLTVKSMEIHPECNKDRCYNVNENIISRGEIKMKLIKSRGGNVENNLAQTLKRRSEKCLNLNAENETVAKKPKSKPEQEKKVGKCKNWKIFPEPDTKLINEINSSFEEYFKSIIKRKNLYRKRKKSEKSDEEVVEDEEEEESSEDEKPKPSEKNGDPIKFVTRFLSTFSQMADMPPLSITIRLGESRTPVKVNLLPPSEKEVRYRGRKHRRKTRIESVDGPADDSSEEESAGGDPPRWSSGQKKRTGHYKPLNVVVYGSSSERSAGRKRKMPTEVQEVTVDGRKEKKTFPSRDRFGVCREKPKSWPPRGRKKETISRGSPMRTRKELPNLNVKATESDVDQELDFIGDSDEERKRKRAESETKQKRSHRGVQTRIPQADTEAVTTTDEEVVEKEVQDEPEPVGGAQEGVPSPEPSFIISPTEHEGKLDQPGTSFRGYQDDVATQQFFTQGLLPSSGKNSPRVSPEVQEFSPALVQSQQEPLSYSSGASQIQLSQLSPGKHSPGLESQKEPLSNSPTSRSLEFGSGDRYLESDPESGTTSLSLVLGSTTIKPKREPLTRQEVLESLQRYNILESEPEAPFYGNPLDVTKAVDTGFRVLKIETRSVAGLKSYKSSLDILGTENRRNVPSNVQKTRWKLVGSGDITITPLMKPPSPETVLRSLCVRREEESLKRTKVKVVKPLSPGQEESEEEMELSVTASNFSQVSGSSVASPKEDANRTTELNLKKGPLEKIKGVKRLALLKSQDGRSGGSDSSKERISSKEEDSFQIRGVTVDNTFGFSHSVEDLEKVKLTSTHQYMSMLVMEVHVQTRRELRPDPEYDPIRALFYAMTFDNPTRSRTVGVIVVGEGLLSGTAPSVDLCVEYVPTEKALLEKFLTLVRNWDPEIFAGYEIEMHSWGYLVQRGFVLEMNFLLLLGRVQPDEFAKKNTSENVQPEDDADDVPRSVRHMRISGRIVLDVWRVLRHEIALTSYTFENVMYHLSQERHPLLSHDSLSYYWEHPTHRFRHLVVEHFTTRVLGLIKILDQLDFINRTSELSRLFGIQFYEVLSRGSQFRVESMMLRLAKPLNYVPASPSQTQRAFMRAPASLPLILEPESLFYTDPVIVLDFQSLYPSIIIAYNYCFSTCLGRVEKLGGREPFEFGCTQLQISPEELKKLENDLTISPAGIAFVNSNIRKGVLPAMLEKILETRLMVKKAMKENKENKLLQKVLFARQLGLKLIANVTYGYTAANFSGRMPCIEVGDSVVSKGRETLHRAIQLVKNTREWGARVVYGDTDSIFVLTPGRSREEAFRIGAEIAEAVTRDNPKPVKLKLEKVYQPSILQTKKRYVGYMFESPEQKKPVFEAKGIETVRRDGCPAIGKILEKALRILFDTRDVSLVKKYTLRQFSKLYQGRVNVQDLIFAKEYRGRKGYRPGACVPALQLARQWTQQDKRAEPRKKQRVPYVIVNGPPGVPLIRLVRSPEDLLSDTSLRINAAYYITKAIIPPMQRCFSLLGADVAAWYADMPRKYHRTYKGHTREGQKRSTISQYFPAVDCVVCSEVTTTPVCQKCQRDPQTLAVVLVDRIRRWERCQDGLEKICRSCCGGYTDYNCVSLDCPVLFRRKQAERTAEERRALREILTGSL